MISIITISNIRQLAQRVRYPWMGEVILVDWGCDDTINKSKKKFERDVTIEVSGIPYSYHAPRNVGAAAARGSWLFFLDADMVVTMPTLLEGHLNPDCFYVKKPEVLGYCNGTLLVHKDTFNAVGGYQKIDAYSQEDVLFKRLESRGFGMMFMFGNNDIYHVNHEGHLEPPAH